MSSLIIGSRGQDGTLLSELLTSQKREWVGLDSKGKLHTATSDNKGTVDILNIEDVTSFLQSAQPKHIYYLPAWHNSSERVGAQSAFNDLKTSLDTHCAGLLNFLQGIHSHTPQTRLFYASSSLIFSGRDQVIQTENSPIEPQGYYGITKSAGMQLCRLYRESHSVFASSGILFNHESHLRKPQYLPRKIIDAAICAHLGENPTLTIAAPEAQTDWGYAPDFVDAFQRILETDTPNDFIVATNSLHKVEDLLNAAFGYFNLDWKSYTNVDPSIISRKPLPKQGDFSRLHECTGWKPSLSFNKMIATIIERLLEQQRK